jgi:hypothetical protein
MKWLIVTPSQNAELEAINEAHPFQKCEPVETADGVLVTTTDKIGSSYWADWQEWLLSLAPFEGTPAWPDPFVEAEITNP